MARLPFSTDRMTGRDIDLQRDDMPVRLQHPIRDIDDEMDNIIYNVISILQERGDENELRTFQYNLLSDNNYANKDFSELIGTIGDLIDIGVTAGNFRDVRDAVIAVSEDAVTLHAAYQVEEFPDLEQYLDRNQQRPIDKAIAQWKKYLDACDLYRDNGNQMPQRGRGRSSRDRDDRDDRGGPDYGSRRGGGRSNSSRRDSWNRGAVRETVQGNPRRRNQNTRDNSYGGNDQDDRFKDDVVQPIERIVNRDDRSDDTDYRDLRSNDRGNRDENRGNNSDRNAGRFDDDKVAKPSVQKMPLHSDSDIDDALGRDRHNTQGDTMNQTSKIKRPIVDAGTNANMWMPTPDHPHPFVSNHSQNLAFELDLENKVVKPILIKKDAGVKYQDHQSIAFGPTPKDYNRFSDEKVVDTLDALHEALYNDTKPIPRVAPVVKAGTDGQPDELGPVDESIRGRHVDYTEERFIGMSIQEVAQNAIGMMSADAATFDSVLDPVMFLTAHGTVFNVIHGNQDEVDLIGELRTATTLTKLAEKMRLLAKKVRPAVFLQLDRYLAQGVNHMVKQSLSIPGLSIDSFTGDWLEIFSHITDNFGDAFRNAIVAHQGNLIQDLLSNDLTEEDVNKRVKTHGPFVSLEKQVKLTYVRAESFNLDIDMMNGVASQLLKENNPFIWDMVNRLIDRAPKDFGRFYIMTDDGILLEASRSFLNPEALLLRPLGTQID